MTLEEKKFKKRQSWEKKAFDIARADMENNGIPDEEIWKEIKRCSDTTLVIYIVESEG